MTAPAASRATDLTPDQLSRLRPYVVNLNEGVFSSGGSYQTTEGDVDEIFDRHLPAFIENMGTSRPVPIAIYAHGGLVAEEGGLRIAHDQVPWWRAMDAYPLHFVWESGLLDALKQLVRDVTGRRDLWDRTTDPLIEATVRPLGRRVWRAMKQSAEIASSPDGGARYVAERLAAFCKERPGKVELHAIGHSAGAIFHAHFMPMALDEGVDPFKTLQLLAPAIRVDEFRQRLEPVLGQGLGNLTVFTMKRELERADNCIGAYRKSLLYLISQALERESGAPILGLEDSIRGDAHMRGLFGLDRSGAGRASVFWSRTDDNAPKDSRSTSTSHGGFDNDEPTMGSVARRVTGRDDVPSFPLAARSAARSIWVGAGTTFQGTEPSAPSLALPATVPSGSVGGKTRRALCVGINDYPDPDRLEGCVADAEAWSDALAQLGFATDLLLDGEATREAIVTRLTALLHGSAKGDLVVFQYSGHGTEFPDDDGDEIDGTNGDKDEALCPVDFASGALLLDDDIRTIIDGMPDGVGLTVITDCCHSGSNTRFAATPRAPSTALGSARPRYVPATRGLRAAHRAYRKEHPSLAAAGSAGSMRHVAFSACLDHEVAYENDGQGDFTRVALDLLSLGSAGLTNESFVTQVVAALGPDREQTPQLDCAPSARTGRFLAPAGGGGPGAADTRPTGERRSEDVVLARALRAAAAVLESG